MKLTSILTILICLLCTFSFSPLELNAYGYQPDSEGYAYTESTTAISNSNIIPLAAVITAIIIGAVLYSGNNHSHHHSH